MAETQSALAASFAEVVTHGSGPWSQYKSNFLRAFDAHGGIKIVDGAPTLEFPLDTEMGEGGFLATPLATVSTSETDTYLNAKYEWAEMLRLITITYRGEAQNSGSKNRTFDRYKAQIASCRDAHDKALETAIVAAAKTQQLESLQTLATAAGTGIVGDINSGTSPYWANQFASANTNGSDIEVASGALYDMCADGSTGDFPPSLIVSGSETRALLIAAIEPKQRFDAGAKKAKASFEAISFRNADWISSSVFAGDDAIFLNTKVTKLHGVRHWYRTIKGEAELPNAAGKTVKLYSMVALATASRRSMGRLVVS